MKDFFDSFEWEILVVVFIIPLIIGIVWGWGWGVFAFFVIRYVVQ